MIRVDRDEALAVVTVDRQDALNALDVATLTDLRDRLRELADDGDVRVVVLTGAGEKAFVAGADIKYMSGLDVDQAKEWGALGHEAGRLLETMPKPTIAAINGFALGGGCELALACDIRYAAGGAKVGQPEVNLGIIPGWGGTQRLARVCGLGVAKELIFTGRVIGADEALRIGLVNAVHDPVLEKARETAALLASKSPVALRAMKDLANRALGGDHGSEFASRIGDVRRAVLSYDAKEGMTAFVEKREPVFRRSWAAYYLRARVWTQRGGRARRRPPRCALSVARRRLRPDDDLLPFAASVTSPSFAKVGASVCTSVVSGTAIVICRLSFVSVRSGRPRLRGRDADRRAGRRSLRRRCRSASARRATRLCHEQELVAFCRYGYGLTARPPPGCTSKWRCDAIPFASPESPT